MHRHLVPYVVTMARFGLLLSLALWTGTASALLLSIPVLFKRLARAEAGAIAEAMLRRADRLLLACLAVLAASLSYRVAQDGAAPSAGFAVPVAAMVASRLLSVFALSPAVRALRARLGDDKAPPTEAERRAFGRLHAAATLLMTLEAILGGYALFALS